ncbi:MAG: DctP family TRAP transporter solute-binding subunit [Oscillospiraceae bacterium]
MTKDEVLLEVWNMNRCKRWLALLLGAVLLLGTMSGCSGTTASDSEDGAYRKINLSMAVNGTDTQIDSLVAHHFADLVAERSGGSITIDVFPNDTLAGGNSTKGVEYIAVGAADLGAYATCVLANIEPKMSVATLPWSFTSYQEARQVIDTTGGAYYTELLDAKGITYLGSFHNGFRQLTNSKHPVTTPEDLKDLKIRVPGSAVYMGVFKALGASPTAMSWSEVFTAIQQKTIDGQENGCSVTKSAKMDEIQKYMTIWNYSYENDLFVANKKVWESLDENTQALLQQCASDACEWGRDRLEAEEDELIQGFQDAGMQVDILTEEQLQAFKDAVSDVTAELKAQYGEAACAAFGIE